MKHVACIPTETLEVLKELGLPQPTSVEDAEGFYVRTSDSGAGPTEASLYHPSVGDLFKLCATLMRSNNELMRVIELTMHGERWSCATSMPKTAHTRLQNFEEHLAKQLADLIVDVFS